MVNIFKQIFLVSSLTMVMLTSSIVFLSPSLTYAAAGVPCSPVDGANDQFLGIPKWYKYLNGAQDGTGRCSPTIDSSASALPIGLAVLEGLLRVAGLVSVAMVFVGSYKYILSVGNPEKATSARKTIQNALIGLVIVIVSTGTVSFVGNRLTADAPTTFAPSGVS